MNYFGFLKTVHTSLYTVRVGNNVDHWPVESQSGEIISQENKKIWE
jgi:hypothetical protein